MRTRAPETGGAGATSRSTHRARRARPRRALLARYIALVERAHDDDELLAETDALLRPLEIYGYCLMLRGKFDAARDQYERTLRIARALHGGSSTSPDPNVIQSVRPLEQIGMVEFAAGNYDAARARFKEAHDTLLFNGRGEFDVDVMRMCNNVAVATCKKGPGAF